MKQLFKRRMRKWTFCCQFGNNLFGRFSADNHWTHLPPFTRHKHSPAQTASRTRLSLVLDTQVLPFDLVIEKLQPGLCARVQTRFPPAAIRRLRSTLVSVVTNLTARGHRVVECKFDSSSFKWQSEVICRTFDDVAQIKSIVIALFIWRGRFGSHYQTGDLEKELASPRSVHIWILIRSPCLLNIRSNSLLWGGDSTRHWKATEFIRTRKTLLQNGKRSETGEFDWRCCAWQSGASKGLVSNQPTPPQHRRGCGWIFSIPSIHALTDEGLFTELQPGGPAERPVSYPSTLDGNARDNFERLSYLTELKTRRVRYPDCVTAQEHRQHLLFSFQKWGPPGRDDQPHELWCNARKAPLSAIPQSTFA